jgi:hypothetical protein
MFLNKWLKYEITAEHWQSSTRLHCVMIRRPRYQRITMLRKQADRVEIRLVCSVQNGLHYLVVKTK